MNGSGTITRRGFIGGTLLAGLGGKETVLRSCRCAGLIRCWTWPWSPSLCRCLKKKPWQLLCRRAKPAMLAIRLFGNKAM